MAKLRETAWDAKQEARTGSFYGRHRHTGITMKPPETIFTAAIDDVYGPHVVFGDEAEQRIKEKAKE